MAHDLNEAERMALLESVKESYMEIFPTPTIESRLGILDPGSYIAVTCSPSRGVDETLDMSERLANRGFKVVPHIAARMVHDKAHLRRIIDRINNAAIVSLFVPGGDAERPLALAPVIANRKLMVAGQHVFSFNQVERAEKWRHDFVTLLESQ
jgi:5,10-methylenetetrahydrofolate reductase